MRTMTTEKLLKGMPVLQTQIDTLLEFDVCIHILMCKPSVCSMEFLFYQPEPVLL